MAVPWRRLARCQRTTLCTTSTRFGAPHTRGSSLPHSTSSSRAARKAAGGGAYGTMAVHSRSSSDRSTQASPGVPADAAAARTAWLGPAAWAALLHGPGSGADSATPLTLLEDAAAAASETEVAGLREMGAGCVLLRLEDQALRPECCVVGWLGAGTSDQQTVMLFCAANDLALLRELYLPRSLPFE